MARALSDDLRSRLLKASSEGMSARQAAARFIVGPIKERRDRKDRGDARFPAALRPRLQPDRERLLKAQGAPARQGRTDDQRLVGCRRFTPRPIDPPTSAPTTSGLQDMIQIEPETL